MNSAELLKKVRKIEIKTRGLSQRLFTGDYHSAFKGRGMSFVEVRPYQFGDDVRFIDWNVTGRYNEPYVKTFEEERELTVTLMIDVSRSDDFGTTQLTKGELITELAAVLSFSAIANNDMVGVVFFSDRIEKYIPPRKGRSHILRIIRELINFQPVGTGTNIGLALHFLTRAVKKKCIAFMLSDFIDTGYEHQLRVASKKHDLIGIHVYDPMEASLPNIGLIQLADSETGKKMWIDTSNATVRKAYNARRHERFMYFSDSFRKNKVDFMNIRTGQAYLPILHNFFQHRM